MKYCKFVLSIICVMIAFSLLTIRFFMIRSYAHPGRTDGSGGHHVSATGEYHYHHGQSAHQHYDIDGDGDLDCPLYFDEEKENNTPKPSTPKPSPANNQKVNVSESSKTIKNAEPNTKKPSSLTYLVAGATLFFALPTISSAFQEKKNKEAWQNEKNKYQQIYGGRNPESFVQIPRASYIGADGLPACGGSKKWGNKYTFYRTEKGTKYHVKFGCSGARIPLNISKIGSYQPCKICKPEPEKIEWFWEYEKIVKIKKDFKID